MGAERPLHQRTSFLLSKRDLEKHTSSSHTKPVSHLQKSSFDIHPRPQSSPPPQTTIDALKFSAKRYSRRSTERGERSKDNFLDSSFAFPTSDPLDDLSSFLSGEDLTPRHPRTRTRTGPSSARSRWQDDPVPPLRFSGTSSFETPPQTPNDASSIRGYPILDFPVLVAAPISGVETLDALVDGMNGMGSMEDLFSRNTSSRSRFALPGHHPLYHPPLPTPPPGIVLGRGKGRRHEKVVTSDDDDDIPHTKPPSRSHPRRTQIHLHNFSRKASTSTITVDSTLSDNTTSPISDSADERPATNVQPTERPRTVIPSISEIIRNHAPQTVQQRSHPPSVRTPSCGHSNGHSVSVEDDESEPEPLTADEEVELLTRSSMDSIEDEVRRTYNNQKNSRVTAPPRNGPRAPPFASLPQNVSDASSVPLGMRGAFSDTHTNSSSTTSAHAPQQSIDPIQLSVSPTSMSQAIAEYLHSARLTMLLKLTRYPHASLDHPLTVSLADMGDPNGFPLIVFLGLGCVRHILGLYDEMADCLGLRLIAIDRWGLGRSEVPQSKSARGIMEWASAVEEVLDQLNIYECSVMAHSAGAPYALSFANRVPERIRGELCLLSPWIGGGESGGYKWLKYVPNGILKTAQAAEWKIQAWMLGKPPAIAYRGIGYTAPPSPSRPYHSKSVPATDSDPLSQYEQLAKSSVYPSQLDARRRMSVGSSLFSDYDDLRDFDGRFGSQSTLGARSMNQQNRRKPSRGLLGRLKPSKSASQSQPPSPSVENMPQSSVGKKLKTLRSMGSLKGKSSTTANGSRAEKVELPSPRLPQPVTLDVGLGLGDFDWSSNSASQTPRSTRSADTGGANSPYPRQAGRRSISFSASSASAPRSTPPSILSSPRNSVVSSPYGSVITTASNSYQVALGNALIAASHAEASKGTHSDLLQILNHDNRPWGFSYSDYPHKVRVWYGDRDEKIAENAVRWMERAMGEDRCHVKVVKGADHGLMYKSSVVVEVLDCVREFW
ncbi:hypothetical protein PAXRUDRAFT_133445 [Paxillus rubicundulus Ve08.2h10]|uniref:Alpha/beta-hydrolase n=1 Tax=Paxillus rubicundulus Ve08.2h10 TaxID=930991 RepID=A0A0D0E3J9_9AGAM|nr:hypothetical protein PAXRUDRAFT_133445 [Paxillus rubicundulus Ve08.2h10]